jgi:soluble P-type ATPase
MPRAEASGARDREGGEMIDLDIPGHRRLALDTLVCDFNGTLACDGSLIASVRPRLAMLAARWRIRFVTADTFGTARRELAGIPGELDVLAVERQAEAKRALVESMGAQRVVAIGNGRNDALMLARAALAIGVMGDEGIAVEALQACHVVVRDVADALDLLLVEKRLVSTLRA